MSALESDGHALRSRCMLTRGEQMLALRRSRMEAGSLTIHGSFFDIADGFLRVLDPETGQFQIVDVFEELDAAA
jgi:carbonic anhydrase